MSGVSVEDKLSMAKFLESATVSVSLLNAIQPIVKDDGLKRLVDQSISTTEGQIKGIQEFCQSHGLN